MIRRAPHWYRSEKGWERIHSIWPWAAGFLAGGLYYLNPAPMDDVLRAGFAGVRQPMLNAVSKLEKADDDLELAALELPPDYLFGPLPLKQQIFFAKQALEEDNELGDNYITRMIIDRFDFGLSNAFGKSLWYENGGEGLYDEAVRRYRDLDNQHVKFFNSDRFARIMNIALESKELAQKHLESKDGVALLLKAAKEGSDPYTPHLCTRALALLAIHQKTDGHLEKTITQVPDGLRSLCDIYEKGSGDPLDTRYVTLLLSSILRTVPKAPKRFVECDGIGSIFKGLNKSMYKAVPQHFRLYNDILKREPKAVHKHLVASDEPLSILLGVARSYPNYFEVQEQMYSMIGECIETRGPLEFVEYGGVDIVERAMQKWPAGVNDAQRLYDRWNAMYRSVLNDKECQKYSIDSDELKKVLERVQMYFKEKEKEGKSVHN